MAQNDSNKNIIGNIPAWLCAIAVIVGATVGYGALKADVQTNKDNIKLNRDDIIKLQDSKAEKERLKEVIIELKSYLEESRMERKESDKKITDIYKDVSYLKGIFKTTLNEKDK